MQPATEAVAAFLGGFTAAEGCFTGSANQYRFAIGLGATDRGMCETVEAFLDRGSICDSPRRKPHYDDESTFSVRSIRDHRDTTIPFMDAHLPLSHKREQYLAWRERLFDYWEHKAKRVRPCTVEGCDKPRRAHGLCRHHLYVQYRM